MVRRGIHTVPTMVSQMSPLFHTSTVRPRSSRLISLGRGKRHQVTHPPQQPPQSHPSLCLSPWPQDSGESPGLGTGGALAVGGPSPDGEMGRAAGLGNPRVAPGYSQHEVLLPGGQVAPHRDGCALDILHLQCHVGVKLLCRSNQRVKWPLGCPPPQLCPPPPQDTPHCHLLWGPPILPLAPQPQLARQDGPTTARVA